VIAQNRLSGQRIGGRANMATRARAAPVALTLMRCKSRAARTWDAPGTSGRIRRSEPDLPKCQYEREKYRSLSFNSGCYRKWDVFLMPIEQISP
jgi:hypothetical protein